MRTSLIVLGLALLPLLACGQNARPVMADTNGVIRVGTVGSELTALNGTQVTTGTVAEARIDAALLRAATAATLYQGTNANLTTLGTLNGGALTNLNSTNLTGTVPTNVLPGILSGLSVGDGSGLLNIGTNAIPPELTLSTLTVGNSPTTATLSPTGSFTLNGPLSVLGLYTSTLNSSTNEIRVSGSANLNSNLVLTATSGRTFAAFHRKDRIKSGNAVTSFDLTSINAGTFAYKIKVVRPNLSETLFEVVGDSGWLTNTFTANKTNHVVLATPIPCREGDIPAYYHAGSQIVGAITDTGGQLQYAESDLTGYGNTFSTTVTNYSLGLRFYTLAPDIAFTGDSIMAGSNNGTNWVPQLAFGGIYGQIEHSIPHQLVRRVSLSYGNFARGSQNFAWVESSAMPAITNSGAGALWIHCGVNDIFDGRSWSDVLTNLNNIRSIWPTNKPLILAEILPYTDGNDAQAVLVRTFNANFHTWASTNNATVAVLHDAFGQTRVSTGELDDLKSEYDYDGTHLTLAGVQKYAELMLPYLASNTALGANITGPVSSDSLVIRGTNVSVAPSGLSEMGAQLWTDGTNLNVVMQDAVGTRTSNSVSTPVSYFFYNTNQSSALTTNITVPSNWKQGLIEMVGGGGAGGSGRRGAAGGIRSGGGGGSGGNYSSRSFSRIHSPFWTNSLLVSLAAISLGGAGPTTDDSNGTNGANSVYSYVYVGSAAISNTIIAVATGSPGVGGDNNGSSGGSGPSIGDVAGTAGGASSSTGDAGAIGSGGNSKGGRGGGAGGGITAADAPGVGGGGLPNYGTAIPSSLAGGAINGAPTASWATIFPILSSGWFDRAGGHGAPGSGGATNIASANGGDGEYPGSGGGGSGATLNGYTPGRGGNGGPSACWITFY